MATASMINEEDAARANIYKILAALLASPPNDELLQLSANLVGDDTEFGHAISGFAKIAARADEASVRHEYHDLFIGLGRGELLPFGSYYLTGFLHEKPLARLRNTLSQLGVERADDVKEPEDHIAFLCEIMAGLITGDFDAPASIEQQKAFFDDHIGPWASHFFKDLEKAKSSVLYAALGSVGKAFMNIERESFQLD